MKRIIFIALVATAINSHAQPEYVDRIGFKLESIADIDIGWMKLYKPSAPAKEKQLGNRRYSANQISYSQQFIQWMQQSYMPKGCLGDVGYYQNAIPKFSGTNSRLGNARNEHLAALPHMYGAYSKMYMFLKKDAEGKFVPQNSFGEYWRIEVNQLQYISNPVSFISSAEEYYFVMPNFNDNASGYSAPDNHMSNLMGFNDHKSLQQHIRFYVPPKIIDDFSHYVVIMTKNQKLPFEKITIGEFFTQVEKQFPVWQKVDPLSPENLSKAQENLARLKEKYRSKWNDVAELRLRGTDISLYDFVNATPDHDDMFDNKKGVQTTFPILKVSKEAMALAKTDQPQWLVIRWTMGMANQPFNIHLHESILSNFNFDYAYDFFFDRDKVKGQAYKPMRSPTFKETVAVIESSEATKKNAADKNIFFFEDFSSMATGKKPQGWQTPMANGGTMAVVRNRDGLDGNWVELTGHRINAAQLKKPIPQDFTFSYDLAVPQNFTWGAKGLTMQLSKETSPGNAESYLMLRLRPGFDGRDGEAMLEAKFPSPPGYSNGTKWYVANGFSNNKKVNRISVTIKKIGEKLQVFIDKNKIAEYEKAIPASHLFNALSFDCSGNSAENDKYYISNIKIVKE